MTREEAAQTIYGLILRSDESEDGCYIYSDEINALNMAIKVLEQPEQKKGKWEWDAEEGYWCSECKEYVYGCTAEIMEGSYKFCPFCGSENEENQWKEGKE